MWWLGPTSRFNFNHHLLSLQTVEHQNDTSIAVNPISRLPPPSYIIITMPPPASHCRTTSLLPLITSALLTLTQIDHRNRLSNFLAPSGGIADKNGAEAEDIHSLLLRAGYLRQAHAGIFHYLPFGLRVHEKLERLIDKHMRSLGASKLALSSISSEKLWEKSGRLAKGGAELMRFKSRGGIKHLLAPTHEEEITTLIGSTVSSYKQLPLRVYQIGRKYRDERRPRAGLLRAKEFTMKDLYTFDATEAAALDTYADVQVAYRALFDELGLPYLVAEADSGNMGGNLSHEYLYSSSTGEDTIISCTSCPYTANSEAATSRPSPRAQLQPSREEITVHHSITTDKKTLVNTYYLRSSVNALGNLTANEVNLHRIKELVPDLDPSVSHPLDLFLEHFTPFSTTETTNHSQIINLFDSALPFPLTGSSFSNHTDHAAAKTFIADKRIPTTSINTHPSTNAPLSLLKSRIDDSCPHCSEGRLKSTTAIELGHTFHLGTRYSVPLGAVVANADQQWTALQQGCHGLGVSRMIAAIAEGHRDNKGLGWPRVVAPFEVCVVCHPEMKADAETVYDVLAGTSQEGTDGMDVIFDDRDLKDLMWKMRDADLVGYPVFVVLGRSWKKEQLVEVQSRRKDVRINVPLAELRGVVEGLLAEL